jgi:hypothetical protein
MPFFRNGETYLPNSFNIAQERGDNTSEVVSVGGMEAGYYYAAN